MGHLIEFMQQPRFADAGFAAHHNRLAAAIRQAALHGLRERFALGRAADKARADGDRLFGDTVEAPDFDRFWQTLDHACPERRAVDPGAQAACHRRRSQGLAWIRQVGQARGQVH